MLKFMKKVPAGMLLVPMLISAALFTLFPGYSEIGGSTQWLLSSDGTGFIVGAIVFFSGTLINVKSLLSVLKRQGILIIVKTICAIAGTWVYIQVFGTEGIFGISILAVVLALSSLNPSMFLSLVTDYGKKEDAAAFGLIGAFALPFYPILIYGVVGSSGSLDLMPMLSTLIPLFAGMILGNLDPDFTKLFGPGVSILLPILGWNIGYGLNLVSALQSGISGVILAGIFYFFMSPLHLTDRFILKNDGISGTAMTCVAGLTVSYAQVMVETYPALTLYLESAQIQVLTVVVITALVTPLVTKRQFTASKAEKVTAVPEVSIAE